MALILAAAGLSGQPPNIVLLLTDDQGYGDLGYYGNPHLKTPAIDTFARQSIEFSRFYVSPVCAPTRASLLTGRYNYRTGVTDTWKGRAVMHQDEVTLAEVLNEAGYATGLFGKWHLGDSYPYRPQDQGFEEVLMHRGGGIGQPSDLPGNSYFDPILWHNGQSRQYTGYCMDVYTNAALDYMEANRDRPFFIYLATNTPHTPLQVPGHYPRPYLDAGLPEETAKLYGMVANIDENFARVLEKIDQLGLSENTLVIFMSDNGPRIVSEARHLAGLKGAKTDVYEGGIRVPFFLRWPERFESPARIETIAAHIDLMPTLLAACGLTTDDPRFDGRNLLPLIESGEEDWPRRTLFLQWHRGDAPTPYRNFTAVETRYKLLQRENKFKVDAPLEFELYDLQADPGETSNVAEQNPEVAARLRAAYDRWLADVSSSRSYPELPAWIGSARENPVVLTHQDRRGSGSWGTENHQPEAYWPVRILSDGLYNVSLILFSPTPETGTATIRIGEMTSTLAVDKNTREIHFPSLRLEAGEGSLFAEVEFEAATIAPRFVRVQYIEKPH
jgi:arylsulfatase A-like enzyme